MGPITEVTTEVTAELTIESTTENQANSPAQNPVETVHASVSESQPIPDFSSNFRWSSIDPDSEDVAAEEEDGSTTPW